MLSICLLWYSCSMTTKKEVTQQHLRWISNFVPEKSTQCVLTFMDETGRHSQVNIAFKSKSVVEVDEPYMIDDFSNLIKSGKWCVLISRNFEKESFVAPNGRTTPYQTIRAWTFRDAIADPIDAVSLCQSFSVDAMTGEPLGAVPSERYETGWLLTGNPGGV